MLSAIVETGMELLRQEPPSLWRAAWYAVVLNVMSLPLIVVWNALCNRVIPSRQRLDLPGFRLLRSVQPSRRIASLLPFTTTPVPDNPVGHLGVLTDYAGHWDVYGYIAIDSTAEELLLRGVPLVVALSLDVSPIGAVLAGTLLWVSLHDIRGWPNSVLIGLLYAWLWLSGAWYLAIALHIVGNWVLHTSLRVRYWREERRLTQWQRSDA